MSKIDYQALREAAEKALHGEWGYEAGAIWNTCDSGYVQHMAAVEAGDEVSDEEHMSNMRFITLATPTVVLGLLDELSEAKAAEENESSCANSVIDIAINWQMRAKDAEAKLEAAEKRIAELSASHSKLRDTMAGIHNTIRMDGGYTPLAAILNAAKRAYEESASAAGIRIKGE